MDVWSGVFADHRASVVDQDVNSAKIRYRIRYHFPDFELLGNVDRQAQGAGAQLLQFFNGLVGFLGVAGGDYYAGPGAGQALCHAKSQATVAAGDNCYFSGQVEKLRHFHTLSPQVPVC